jgi:hypothetical protein
LKSLGIESVTDVMRRGRLRWYGHVERKSDEDWTLKCQYIEVEGKRRNGRGKKTWVEGLTHDMKLFGMTKEMAQDREMWKNFHSGKPSNPCIAWKNGRYKRQ